MVPRTCPLEEFEDFDHRVSLGLAYARWDASDAAGVCTDTRPRWGITD